MQGFQQGFSSGLSRGREEVTALRDRDRRGQVPSVRVTAGSDRYDLGRNPFLCGRSAGGAVHSEEAAGHWGGYAGVPHLLCLYSSPEASVLVMPHIGR